MTRGWFITGTDTGVGKTYVAQALLTGLRRAGRSAVGMKPVASGCRMSPAGLRSDDAEGLIAASAVACDYADVNPYALAQPIAPHLAARAMGIQIDIDQIQARFERLRAAADWVVVEGVGGWRVPIDAARTMADVAVALRLPVILVVGLRLGCINHALLTAAGIKADGVRLAGWIANPAPESAPMPDVVAAIAERLDAPLLAVMSRGAGAAPALAAEAIARLVVGD